MLSQQKNIIGKLFFAKTAAPLKQGTIITAKIVKTLAQNRVTILVNGKYLQAEFTSTLPKNKTIKLFVRQIHRDGSITVSIMKEPASDNYHSAITKYNIPNSLRQLLLFGLMDSSTTEIVSQYTPLQRIMKNKSKNNNRNTFIAFARSIGIEEEAIKKLFSYNSISKLLKELYMHMQKTGCQNTDIAENNKRTLVLNMLTAWINNAPAEKLYNYFHRFGLDDYKSIKDNKQPVSLRTVLSQLNNSIHEESIDAIIQFIHRMTAENCSAAQWYRFSIPWYADDEWNDIVLSIKHDTNNTHHYILDMILSHIGTIKAWITESNSAVSVKIFTDSNTICDFIQNHKERLNTSLSRYGLILKSFYTSLRSDIAEYLNDTALSAQELDIWG